MYSECVCVDCLEEEKVKIHLIIQQLSLLSTKNHKILQHKQYFSTPRWKVYKAREITRFLTHAYFKSQHSIWVSVGAKATDLTHTTVFIPSLGLLRTQEAK